MVMLDCSLLTISFLLANPDVSPQLSIGSGLIPTTPVLAGTYPMDVGEVTEVEGEMELDVKEVDGEMELDVPEVDVEVEVDVNATEVEMKETSSTAGDEEFDGKCHCVRMTYDGDA